MKRLLVVLGACGGSHAAAHGRDVNPELGCVENPKVKAECEARGAPWAYMNPSSPSCSGVDPGPPEHPPPPVSCGCVDRDEMARKIAACANVP